MERIAPRAVMLLHGEMDVLVGPDESVWAAARAGEPYELVVLPGMGHFNWVNPKQPFFDEVACRCVEFLTEQLG